MSKEELVALTCRRRMRATKLRKAVNAAADANELVLADLEGVMVPPALLARADKVIE